MLPDSQRLFRRKLLAWYGSDGRDLPWRQTTDPYAILISEVMLQQTQVATVLPYYEKWLKRFATFAALAAASETEVLHAWQGLGYYSRARNVHAAAKLVVSRHGGILPRDPEVIKKLPGIGRYTSNAIATFAFDQPVAIVEANIARLLARLFDIRECIDSAAGRDRLWQVAAALVPTDRAGRFNSALMDLGALICTNRQPKCGICPVKACCQALQPELLPIKQRRRPLVQLIECHTFVRQSNKLLLEHCSKRWRGMWMLPRLRSRKRQTTRPIHTSFFPFTNHRINLRIFHNAPAPAREPGRQWIAIEDLDSIPIPSPHRRAINACLLLDVQH